MSQKDNLYFGGGSLFVIPLVNGVADETQRIDIGCLELTLSKDSQKTTAWTRANGAKQKLAEVITEENTTLKIKGNNFSIEALSLVLGSYVHESVVKKGESLPYGGVATKDTTIKSLQAGSKSEQAACRLEFIGRPVMGRSVHAIFYEVNLSLDGDLNLLAEEFSSLSLSGACVASDQGVYTYYSVDESDAPTPSPTKMSEPKPSSPQPSPTSAKAPSDDNDLEAMVENLENAAISAGHIEASQVQANRDRTKALEPSLDVQAVHG
ncbi:hypothetical protein NHP190003_13450 [Helicobacter sp. NHP19-003]|uniref:Phage tail protein n=1 Tax=Helicobacter gastrocanis TaxID=2849641 RepID=A0ABM7SBQ2_9HELI|nr:hypothetical protein [Helicobacter sp. NHP19-003]BCZ18063.1 hypothetical protein NHP190003_13450 [Helicobacter sp. NHP19-003]